jgi:hypothetical protein
VRLIEQESKVGGALAGSSTAKPLKIYEFNK